MISFLLPAYNEELNVPLIAERIATAARALKRDYEIVFVDDHSADDTSRVLRKLSESDPRIRYARLSRNSGSHIAILCGLRMVRGEAVLILAADGQDPPELLGPMLEKREQGAKVVWGTRRTYHRPWSERVVSTLFWKFAARFTETPPMSNNADMVLLDRRAIDVLAASQERNLHLWGLVGLVGFRQDSVPYDKKARVHGKSGWTFFKKVKAALDVTVGYSYAPIRLCSAFGVALSSLSIFTSALYVANHFSRGAIFGTAEVPGWTSIFVAFLFLTGIQMLLLGLFGEYVWRVLDQVRGRPMYLVEEDSTSIPHTTSESCKESPPSPDPASADTPQSPQ